MDLKPKTMISKIQLCFYLPDFNSFDTIIPDILQEVSAGFLCPGKLFS
jgi:hypothetical protein